MLIEELGHDSINHDRFLFLHSRSQGFTLLEISIVIIIIGIASVLVGIMINTGSGRLELRTLAKEISATLRYARNHAVAEKKPYCFVFNLDDAKYRLYGGDENKENLDESEGLVPVISKSIPDDVEVIFDDEEREEFYQIEFFPLGNSSGALIELRREKGASLFIKVHKLSGKVEVLTEED